MKNVSKNGIQAAVVYSESYLGHKPYPDFSLGGDHPFTIEVRFAFTKSNGGSLYMQQDGMEIGFKDDKPYFLHPTLGNLYGPIERKLKANSLIMVSVKYDCNDIKMQINGIECASENKKSGDITTNTGDFLIGKGFDGFIEGIRVLKTAIDDKELIADYGLGFRDREDVAFQTDFTTQQFKDIGPNKIPLWRTGNDAHCANVVTATRVNADSAYVRHNKLSFDDALTICGRLYPDFSGGKKQTVYAIGKASKCISLVLEPNEENRFFPAIEVGNQVIKASKEIEGLMWHDIAASIDLKQCNASLYLDGEMVADGGFDQVSLVETVAIVASEFFTENASFKGGFSGYIDYFAELAKNCNPDNVCDFIEHEPYFYTEGIQSLFLFGWGEPSDAIRGKALAEYGEGYYTMVADTCPLDAPRGNGWVVPEEPDEEYWATLTDNQKWALSTYVNITSSAVENLLGTPLVNPNSHDMEIVHRRYLDPSSREILDWANGDGDYEQWDTFFNTTSQADDLVTDVFENTNSFELLSFGQAAVGAGALSTAVVVGGGYGTTSTSIEYILALEVFAVTSMLVAARLLQMEEENIRPYNPRANLRVNTCSWNENGNPQRGTIYFHTGADFVSAPDSMDWPLENGRVNMRAVFIPSLLSELKMKVSVTNVGDADFVGSLLIQNANDEEIGRSPNVTIRVGEQKTVSINHTGDLASYQNQSFRNVDGIYRLVCQNGGQCEFLCNVNYHYTTLAGRPCGLWQMDEGQNYNRDNTMYVHDELLGLVANDINQSGKTITAEKVADGIVTWMNNSQKLSYDTARGACFYTNNYNEFRRTLFLNHMLQAGARWVNCADCANIVYSIASMHGVDLPMIQLVGPSPTYRCNQVYLISHNAPNWDWIEPFAPNGFSYHQLNRFPGGSDYNRDIRVIDACLKVDVGNYPYCDDDGYGTYHKRAEQPVGMQACDDMSVQVNTDENVAYTGNSYRERLCRPQQFASFLYGILRVVRFDDHMSSVLSTREFIESNGKLETDGRIQELKLLSAEEHLIEWKCKFENTDLDILYYSTMNDPDALKRIAATFTSPQREWFEDESLGIKGVRIGATCCVVGKNNKYYRFIGEKAMEAAKELL